MDEVVSLAGDAGATMELPSAVHRSANLRIHGNGQGAVSTKGYLAELPGLIEEIESGAIGVNVLPVALAEVEAAWRHPDSAGERTVLVP